MNKFWVKKGLFSQRFQHLKRIKEPLNKFTPLVLRSHSSAPSAESLGQSQFSEGGRAQVGSKKAASPEKDYTKRESVQRRGRR